MSQREHSTLLDLPPELRVRIYSYILVCSTPLSVTAWQNQALDPPEPYQYKMTTISAPGLNTRHRTDLPALCLVDRQLRQECQDVFFGKNRFCISSSFCWLWSLSHENVSRIRRIRLEYDVRQCFWASCRINTALPDYSVTCDITLIRREPWYTLDTSCIIDCYRAGGLAKLKDKMDDVLCPTLDNTTEPAFNYTYLVKLLEFWQLWSKELLKFNYEQLRKSNMKARQDHAQRLQLIQLLARKEKKRLTEHQAEMERAGNHSKYFSQCATV